MVTKCEHPQQLIGIGSRIVYENMNIEVEEIHRDYVRCRYDNSIVAKFSHKEIQDLVEDKY